MIKNLNRWTGCFLVMAIVATVSCNQPATEPTRESADSVKTETPQEVIVNTSVDSTLIQLNAPDTLFEDGSIPTSWRNAGFDDPASFKKFVVSLKGWIAADNVDSLTAHIKFPIKMAATKSEFAGKYTTVFDRPFKQAIAAQRIDRIFRNANGAMLSDGKIWLIPDKDKYRIIAINAK